MYNFFMATNHWQRSRVTNGFGVLKAVLSVAILTGHCALGLCQEPQFGLEPFWTSETTDDSQAIALGDINSDGFLDLVCANGFQRGGELNPRRNTIYMSQCGLLPKEPDWITDLVRHTRDVVLVDIDGDFDLDVVFANWGTLNTVYINADGNLPLVIPSSEFGVPQGRTTSLAMGDVDGDGDVDVVTGSFDGVRLFMNLGGVFSDTASWSAPHLLTFGVALGDADNDGDFDLAVANSGYSGEANALYENVDGQLTTSPVWLSNAQNISESVVIGDVDGDGFVDLVFGNDGGPGGQSNALFLNQGGGVFASSPNWVSEPTNLTKDVDLGDVDGDGDLDLVCGNFYDEQNNTLYENIGENDHFSQTPIWMSNPKNDTRGIVLGDVDADGDLDLLCGNTGSPNTLYVNARGDGFSATPSHTQLLQNYPNPFQAGSVIRYELAQAGDVQITIFDVQGRLVTTLNEGQRDPGCYEVTWSAVSGQGESISPGVYFYRMATRGLTETRKMIRIN
jgi:hypothetical protein